MATLAVGLTISDVPLSELHEIGCSDSIAIQSLTPVTPRIIGYVRVDGRDFPRYESIQDAMERESLVEFTRSGMFHDAVQRKLDTLEQLERERA